MQTAKILALVALALALGCNRDRQNRTPPTTSSDKENPDELDKSGVTTLTGASWVANDSAIERISTARCAREVICNSVGPDKHFANGQACMREVKTRVFEDLNTGECPSGIDGKELDECLDAIRNEGCVNPIEMVSRLAACRVGDLCLRAEMPHR
jgi:hypothetical protein